MPIRLPLFCLIEIDLECLLSNLAVAVQRFLIGRQRFSLFFSGGFLFERRKLNHP